jgi:hypothetical protein
VDPLCATSWLYRFLVFSSDAHSRYCEYWTSCGGDTWDYSGSSPGLTHWYYVTCHDTAEINSNHHFRPLASANRHQTSNTLPPSASWQSGESGSFSRSLLISRLAGDHDLPKQSILGIVSTFGTCGGQFVGYSTIVPRRTMRFCWRKLPPHPDVSPYSPYSPCLMLGT